MATKDLDLDTCSREELVAKVKNQREEIKNLQRCYDRAIGRCCDLDDQIRSTRNTLKGIVYDRR